MNWQEEENIAKIISRKLTGDATPEEEATLARWIAASYENRAVYSRLLSGDSMSERRRFEKELDIPGELRAVKQRARRRILRRRLAVGLSGAAVVAVLIVGTIFTVQQWKTEGESVAMTAPGVSQAILTVGNTEPVVLSEGDDETVWRDYVAAGASESETAAEVAMIKVEVPNGGEYKLRLADGTVVWLNSESSIEYPAVFAGDARRLTLSGEAYFEVERDEARPFVLTTGQANITVLGTSFNVSAYKTDESTTATLVSGKIEICSDDRCVELTPGKQAIVAEGAAGIEVQDVDAKLYMAWTTGTFEFENMRLADICTRLSRWYGVEFRFEGNSANERFTGAIWKYKPLGELLKGIEMVTDVSFSYSGDRVVASYAK